MKAGATYNLIVRLPEITDEPSEQEIIDEIIFTINCGSVQLSKVYPSDVSLAGDIYIIPLNQAETKQLVGNCQLEAQVNYTNKAVQKSYIQSFTVSDTLATKDVDGVPDSIHNSELILRLIGSSVLVISIVPEVADEIIKNMNKLYLATKQAMEDTQSYGEQTKSDLQLKLQDALGSINDVAIGQLESINNTARAQIEAINSSAAAAGESQREGINTVASSQISNITNITNQQLKNINTAATHQIEMIENKTTIQIKNINDTATSQISAINSTALSQINAINKTAQSQIKNMTVKYSDMCRTLGIEHEGIMLAKTSYNESSIPHDIYSIDVSKFKYIEFGKIVVTYSNGDYEYTLPAYPISIFLTNLKDDPALEKVTTGKRYDVSLLNDLQFYVSYQGSGGYEVTVNYKLYNKLEETTEE
jgi:hypothetical protein|nr:MAG TPA: hypothetical protein [Caudoviricetes sp.]